MRNRIREYLDPDAVPWTPPSMPPASEALFPEGSSTLISYRSDGLWESPDGTLFQEYESPWSAFITVVAMVFVATTALLVICLSLS